MSRSANTRCDSGALRSPFLVDIIGASDGGSVLRVRGELDMATAPALSSMLQRQLGAGRRRVALDLSGVSFIDCAGLSVLIDSHHRYLAQHGAVVLTALSPPARRLIALAKLQDALFLDADGAAVPAARLADAVAADNEGQEASSTSKKCTRSNDIA